MNKLKLTRQTDGAVTAEIEGDDISWNLSASLVARWVEEEKKAQPEMPDLKAENPFSKDPETGEPEIRLTYNPEAAMESNMRTLLCLTVTPENLQEWASAGTLNDYLHIFDEIDLSLVNGETVTAVCAYVCDTGARFIFKDCWDEGIMNDEDVSENNYFESKGRKHVLEDILPQIAPEWQEIMTPRLLKEDTNNERVEYLDKLWLPSATDMFGEREGRWNDADDSFQLPMFKRKRCRVKECGEHGACIWWLRSVDATDSHRFCGVYTSGGADFNYAGYSYGFAPGFDVGRI